MYLSAKEKEEEQRAILEKQKQWEEVLRQRRRELEAEAQSESITDQEMVDSIFDFLPTVVGGQEGQAPVGFSWFGSQKFCTFYIPVKVSRCMSVSVFRILRGKG